MLRDSVFEEDHINVVVKVGLFVTQWFFLFQFRQESADTVERQALIRSRIPKVHNRRSGRKSNFRDTRCSKMVFRAVAVTMSFVTVWASAAHSESKTGNTGITGVIMVAPNRPGPVRKGSESPNAAPLPNARFTVTSDEKVDYNIHDRCGRTFSGIAKARSLL